MFIFMVILMVASAFVASALINEIRDDQNAKMVRCLCGFIILVMGILITMLSIAWIGGSIS